MKKTCMIIFLLIFMLVLIKPAIAQFDVAVYRNIGATEIDYTNVVKSEMTLELTTYAMADWEIDIALIADSGEQYIITYKNGYSQPSISGNNIVVYWGDNYYTTVQSSTWSEITAPNTLNLTLLGTAADSFSNDTARLTGIRFKADALAITVLSIADNSGHGFIDNFQASNLAQSGWTLDTASTGAARINTEYASSGAYSLELLSTQYSGTTGSTTSASTAGQYYYDEYGNPVAVNPYYSSQQSSQQYYYDQYGNPVGVMPSQYAGYPTSYPTSYGSTGYPYTGGYGYTSTGYPYASTAYPYASQQGSLYGGYSSSSSGSPVYGYSPLYAQQGYSSSGQLEPYSGQLGQGTTGTNYANQPMASPYASGYQYPGAYGSSYNPYGIGAVASPYGALGSPYGGIGAPYGGIGAPLGGIGLPYGGIGGAFGGIGAPLGGIGLPYGGIGAAYGGIGAPLGGIGSPLGGIGLPYGGIGGAFGGIGSPYAIDPFGGMFGLNSGILGANSLLGLSGLGGIPGFSSFNPIGMALFSQNFLF